jgi:hypothetical protein
MLESAVPKNTNQRTLFGHIPLVDVVLTPVSYSYCVKLMLFYSKTVMRIFYLA